MGEAHLPNVSPKTTKNIQKVTKNRRPSKENIEIGNGDEELEQKTQRHKQAQTEQETTLLYFVLST